jgi:hypothetical protein
MEEPTPKRRLIRPGFIVVLLTIFILPFSCSEFLTWWPPLSVERREQRTKTIERVQAAGGWEAIRRDCVGLAAQNTNGFHSYRNSTNLPPAILMLKPAMVDYYPKYGCVRIKIFGMHATGGHSRPYFGLDVETSTNNAGYPRSVGYGGQGVRGNLHSVAEKVADGIYEIY